jgi:hypothetical protein
MSALPVDVWLTWLPGWWAAVCHLSASYSLQVDPTTMDQSSALHRDVWDALGVDPSNPDERHALAVGIAYGARYCAGDHAAAATLVPLRTWGPL